MIRKLTGRLQIIQIDTLYHSDLLLPLIENEICMSGTEVFLPEVSHPLRTSPFPPPPLPKKQETTPLSILWKFLCPFFQTTGFKSVLIHPTNGHTLRVVLLRNHLDVARIPPEDPIQSFTDHYRHHERKQGPYNDRF